MLAGEEEASREARMGDTEWLGLLLSFSCLFVSLEYCRSPPQPLAPSEQELGSNPLCWLMLQNAKMKREKLLWGVLAG